MELKHLIELYARVRPEAWDAIYPMQGHRLAHLAKAEPRPYPWHPVAIAQVAVVHAVREMATMVLTAEAVTPGAALGMLAGWEEGDPICPIWWPHHFPPPPPPHPGPWWNDFTGGGEVIFDEHGNPRPFDQLLTDSELRIVSAVTVTAIGMGLRKPELAEAFGALGESLAQRGLG